MTQSEYPSVLLIYTGGTIGMIENPETGALEAFNFDQLQDNVPELKRFNYRISSYQFNPPIDSSDMEPALWAKLVKITFWINGILKCSPAWDSAWGLPRVVTTA